MEATKSKEELHTMASNSSKDIGLLMERFQSHTPCKHFGDFFRCQTPQKCSKHQNCLRAWMQRAQDSPQF
ncbi:MAG: hypothetical protein ACFFDP_12730 [Promethearchaeota archaeon]